MPAISSPDPRELRERLGVSAPRARVRLVDRYKQQYIGGNVTRVYTGTDTIRESLCPLAGHGSETEFVGVTYEGWVFRCKGQRYDLTPAGTEPTLGGMPQPKRKGYRPGSAHTFVATPPQGA